jgi:hypothetical protein
MHLQLFADAAPSASESLPALSEDLISTVHWIMWAFMGICVGWVIFQGARYAVASSQGRHEPEQLTRAVSGLFGLIVIGGAQLVVSSLAGDGEAEPQDAPIEPPLTPAPPVPAAPAPDEPMNWTPFIAVGAIIAALIGLALLGLIAFRARNQIADRKAAAADREKDWHTARMIFDQTRTKFADYLADPHAVFERPTLDDHTDAFTAAFLTALADAEALHTETVPRSAQRIDEFRTAAATLAAAWTAADRNARKIGMGVLTRGQRKTLTTIKRVLAIALDESATAGERETAMRTVTRLAGELPVAVNTDRIVQKLTLSLENAQRKALTV